MTEGFLQWGLVSVDCAGLWVRDRRELTEALDITPPFLRSNEADAGSWRYFCLLFTPKSVTNVAQALSSITVTGVSYLREDSVHRNFGSLFVAMV